MDQREDKKEEEENESIGIIYPPPDVRAIVDKTAAYVARNGKHFEAKIMSSGMTNLKFGFLRLQDPYRAYYDHKVKSFQEELERKKSEGERAQDDAEKVAEEGTSQKSLAERKTEKSDCLLYTSPSPRDGLLSRMPSSA